MIMMIIMKVGKNMTPMIEGFLLFLIELTFVTIVGLIFIIPVIIILNINNWIVKKIKEYNRRK